MINDKKTATKGNWRQWSLRLPAVMLVSLLILVLLAAIAPQILPSPIRSAKERATLLFQRIRNYMRSYDLGAVPYKLPAEARTSPKDYMKMLRVPAGAFTMGTNLIPSWDPSWPAHEVWLASFWIDQTEVSNRQYALCVSAGACKPPNERNPYYGNWLFAEFPVVYVTWMQANLYCKWADRALPTEAQWEKAARGESGQNYTWGAARPSATLANFENVLGMPVGVMRYPSGASPYGALNMAGNVREWVADWYDPKYYPSSPLVNPLGPESGASRSLRGGAYDDNESQMIVWQRFAHNPASPGINRGFRCATPAP